MSSVHPSLSSDHPSLHSCIPPSPPPSLNPSIRPSVPWCLSCPCRRAVATQAILVQFLVSPLVDPPGVLDFHWTTEAIFWILLSGLAAFLVNFSGFLILGNIGALAHVLLGNHSSSRDTFASLSPCLPVSLSPCLPVSVSLPPCWPSHSASFFLLFRATENGGSVFGCDSILRRPISSAASSRRTGSGLLHHRLQPCDHRGIAVEEQRARVQGGRGVQKQLPGKQRRSWEEVMLMSLNHSLLVFMEGMTRDLGLSECRVHCQNMREHARTRNA